MTRTLPKFTCPDCGIKAVRRSGNQQRCRTCATIRNAATHRAARIAHGYRNGLGHGGAHNGSWKGGVSIKWTRKFRKANCEECGTTDRLEQHHRDRNPRNNFSSNIVTLCKPCHDKAHGAYWKVCTVCSKKYRTVGRTSLFCKKCRKEYRNAYRRTYYSVWRQKQKSKGQVYRDPK